MPENAKISTLKINILTREQYESATIEDENELYMITDEPALPIVTHADNGKILQVVDGAWAATVLVNAEGVSF